MNHVNLERRLKLQPREPVSRVSTQMSWTEEKDLIVGSVKVELT